jgi:FlaA1/EpsC-like NDP-sugar epimerase
VFILDMGKPIKIVDLAKRMIELSGLSLKNEQNPVGDIEIEITKLRPGEKLYEELLIGNNPESTSHPRIMKAREAFVHWEQLESQINIMTDALHANDVDVIRRLVDELVPDYQPKHEIVDWVYAEQEHGNITKK